MADLPVVYENGCHLGIEPEAPAPGCRLGGSPKGPAVVLLGDSHAAQWLPPLLEVASGRGVALWAWTKSSCPFADVTIWNGEARAPYRQCDRWRQAVLAELAGLGPTTIFVSNLMDDATVLVERDSGALLRGQAAAAAALELRSDRRVTVKAVIPRRRFFVVDDFVHHHVRLCQRVHGDAAQREIRHLITLR